MTIDLMKDEIVRLQNQIAATMASLEVLYTNEAAVSFDINDALERARNNESADLELKGIHWCMMRDMQHLLKTRRVDKESHDSHLTNSRCPTNCAICAIGLKLSLQSWIRNSTSSQKEHSAAR